jgi:hypothetical protein
MKKRVVRTVHWPQDFGWHVGDDHKAPVRFASQVVRYEQEVLGNEMIVPESLVLRSSLVITFMPAKFMGRTCLLCLQTLIQSFIRANEERSTSSFWPRWIGSI